MKKTVLIAYLFIGVSNFFSQNTERPFKKGTEFLEFKNPSLSYDENGFSGQMSLGYGYFINKRVALYPSFSVRSSIFSEAKSTFFGGSSNLQYYFSNLDKRLVFYSKINMDVGFRFEKGVRNEFTEVGLYGSLGAEWFLTKKASVFIEGGYGMNMIERNSVEEVRFGPKINIGFKFYF